MGNQCGWVHHLFQSTPANFTAGDQRAGVPGVAHRCVSIHARQFHSGRLRHTDRKPVECMFQSTPANFTAGDDLGADAPILVRGMFQSTPANFTAGDSNPPAPAPAPVVSIHARQFHSGRPNQGVPRNVAAQVFQSTPANFTAGDLRHRRRLAELLQVSIHARQFHSGRPCASG